MRSPKSSLTRIAHNLRWAWHPEVRKVFYEVDPERYVSLRRNPVALLADVSDVPPGAVERADELVRDLDSHLESRNTWADAHAHLPRSRPVAYFSMEYGIHESLPIYAGGLGVLAADHLKSASDLGIPLVAVGMLYREGYFDQTLDEEGWQRESYPRVEPERLPLRPASTPQGEPIRVQVHTRGGPIHAAVWEAAVGRVRLFLLDTDVEDNDEADRALTVRLYAGDTRTRIRQELLLGVGGLRALVAAGIEPGVLHMNEGHSAFAALELTRMRMRDEDLGFAQAAARVTDQSVFTTHTPVPAGHDRFPPDLVEEHLGPLRERLGLDQDGLMGLGRVHAEDEHETFCMTVLAMKMAHRRNGVSNLHGRVSRRMWQGLWPARAEHDVPIGHVTNGVHVPTWMAPEMRALLDKHLDDDWLERQAEPKTWAPIEDIEDDVLWNTHRRLKRKLIEFARRRAVEGARARGESDEIIGALERALDDDALLVGFARRFATYKRASLALWDLEYLDGLVNAPDRPVRLVFAGKAHPRDDGGKRLLQHIHRVSRQPQFLGKILLLEGYDVEVGRHLTSGVDVWLNNPRRPLEASGTSGQKVVLNGGLNCSILDGWWSEAFDGENGFAIGRGLTHRHAEEQDRRDFMDMKKALGEVAQVFYAGDGAWIRRVKRSMTTLAWRFCSDRMVQDYARLSYMPAAGVVPADLPA